MCTSRMQNPTFAPCLCTSFSALESYLLFLWSFLLPVIAGLRPHNLCFANKQYYSFQINLIFLPLVGTGRDNCTVDCSMAERFICALCLRPTILNPKISIGNVPGRKARPHPTTVGRSLCPTVLNPLYSTAMQYNQQHKVGAWTKKKNVGLGRIHTPAQEGYYHPCQNGDISCPTSEFIYIYFSLLCSCVSFLASNGKYLALVRKFQYIFFE